MSFLNDIKEKAKKNIKTIILPEATDVRILKATEIILKEKFANIILIGNSIEINKLAIKNNIDIENVHIEDPANSKHYDDFVEKFYELRKEKGITIENSKNLMLDSVYFGMMMVKFDLADGLVSGAIHSTADTLRPALQIIKTTANTKLVSTFFVMNVPNCKLGENGVFLFSDCGLNENPNSRSLAEIAIQSAKSFEKLVEKQAKVAMLSYSTLGSANSESTQKVIEATCKVKQQSTNILIDGELQLDAAIIPEVAEIKAPNSPVAGHANTLIFPDLNSGNIGYKLVQRLANAEAYGPITQGLEKPVNDLSRGCVTDDIVGAVAITALQAEK